MGETYEIIYSYEGNPSQSCVLRAETFEEALYIANDEPDTGSPLPVHISEWDYANPISIECVDGPYKGESYSGEDISKLFLSKEDILYALENEIMVVDISNAEYCVTCYCADNYFWFDTNNDIVEYSDDIEEYRDNLKAVSNERLAEEIYDVLNEFVTEFPLEYHLYTITIKEHQNANKREKPSHDKPMERD